MANQSVHVYIQVYCHSLLTGIASPTDPPEMTSPKLQLDIMYLVIIVIIGVMVLVILFMVILICVLCAKRRKYKAMEMSLNAVHETSLDNPVYEGTGIAYIYTVFD